MELSDLVSQVVSISPTSLSPVLEGELVITLDPSYSGPMVAEEFVAELNNASDESQGHWIWDPNSSPPDFKWVEDGNFAVRLYVKSASIVDKTVTLKFKGAPRGTYLVFLSSKSQGRLDSLDLQITTSATVTSISPNEGSALGGTIVTITGENFSYKDTSNPVLIGDVPCIIWSSTPTEIVC